MSNIDNMQVFELENSEIEMVNGGIFWLAIAGAAALAGTALLAYQAGQSDGQCHI